MTSEISTFRFPAQHLGAEENLSSWTPKPETGLRQRSAKAVSRYHADFSKPVEIAGKGAKIPLTLSISWFESEPRAVKIEIDVNKDLQKSLAAEVGLDSSERCSGDLAYSVTKKLSQADGELNRIFGYRANSFIAKISLSFSLDRGGPSVYQTLRHRDSKETLPDDISKFLRRFGDKLKALPNLESHFVENLTIFLNRMSLSQENRFSYLKDRVLIDLLNRLQNPEKISIFETLLNVDNSSPSLPGLPLTQCHTTGFEDLRLHFLKRVEETRKMQKSSPSSGWR